MAHLLLQFMLSSPPYVCIFFVLADVSCLRLPPSGGVMSRRWFLTAHWVQVVHNGALVSPVYVVFSPSMYVYLYIFFLLADVSCLRLPPSSGGVMSRRWFLTVHWVQLVHNRALVAPVCCVLSLNVCIFTPRMRRGKVIGLSVRLLSPRKSPDLDI